MKPYFIWSDDYNIGIQKIDRQHRKIFRIYNSIIDNYYCKANCKLLVKDLIDYGFYHLETEERFLKVLGVEDSALHIKEHHSFMLKMTEFKKREENGGLLDEDLVYLLKWLKQHVLVKDKNIFSELSDKYNELNFFQRLSLNF